MHRMNSEIDKIKCIISVKYIITGTKSSGRPVTIPENFHSDIKLGNGGTEDVSIIGILP